MRFKPYVSYLLLRMAHLRGFNSPKIPRGSRGIGSRFPDPRGIKKCNPQFHESPRNENRRGIGIPNWSPWSILGCHHFNCRFCLNFRIFCLKFLRSFKIDVCNYFFLVKNTSYNVYSFLEELEH